MQQYKQKRGDDDYGDGPITAATTERNPQGRVRRDWASMTAAVAQRNSSIQRANDGAG